MSKKAITEKISMQGIKNCGGQMGDGQVVSASVTLYAFQGAATSLHVVILYGRKKTPYKLNQL